MIPEEELKAFLDSKARQYEHPRFLREDPLKIPHSFDLREDIEISAFLTSIIAWGNRKSIIRNARRMMEFMDMAPYQFVTQHGESDLHALSGFVHRTFNGVDLACFLTGLKHLYRNHDGLEGFFRNHATAVSMQPAISRFKEVFFEVPHPQRTRKHLPDPNIGSAAKRMNMFLRWMVRDSRAGVDFGLWKTLSAAQLSCPLDIHSGNVARRLGLLKRKQNDARAVAELDALLRQYDPADPVKYDFALFGLGVFEKWS